MMKRRYNTDTYRERIERLVSDIPDCGIGVDVIVGFPGETDELFEETRRFIADLPCTYLHVFSYSERPATDARNLIGTVQSQERSRRSGILRDISTRKKRAFYESQSGDILDVLYEMREVHGHSLGFTDNYVRIAVPYNPKLENRMLRTRLLKAGDEYVLGDPQAESGQPSYYPLRVFGESR